MAEGSGTGCSPKLGTSPTSIVSSVDHTPPGWSCTATVSVTFASAEVGAPTVTDPGPGVSETPLVRRGLPGGVGRGSSEFPGAIGQSVGGRPANDCWRNTASSAAKRGKAVV